MSVPVPRQYQASTIDEVIRLIGMGIRRILIVAPTAAGKTICFSEIIRRMRLKGRSAVVIAGARELIVQASEKLTAIDVSHGVIMAGYRPRHSDVQVCSVHTLRSRGTIPPADIVILDEVHLARSAIYEKVLENYPNAVILGWTATPIRSDGKGLGQKIKIGDEMIPFFQKMIVMATTRELMESGFIVPVDLENSFFFEKPDTSSMKIVGGDYDEKALKTWAASSTGKKIAGDVIKEYLRRGHGKRAVCFAASVDQSRELTRFFIAAGVPAEHIDGETDKDERRAMFKRITAGTTRVLCNVGVITTGVDLPPLEIVIFVRPTKSVALYLQMLGRAMRTWVDGATGYVKTSMRILDHAGNFEQEGFGFPDDPREWSLSDDLVKAKKKGDVTPLVKKCPTCLRAWRTGLDACWFCGFKPAPAAVKFDETAVAVSLAAVVAKARPERGDKVPPGPERDSMVAELRRLLALSKARQWKPKAVETMFTKSFGFWPHWDLLREAERVPSRAVEFGR